MPLWPTFLHVIWRKNSIVSFYAEYLWGAILEIVTKASFFKRDQFCMLVLRSKLLTVRKNVILRFVLSVQRIASWIGKWTDRSKKMFFGFQPPLIDRAAKASMNGPKIVIREVISTQDAQIHRSTFGIFGFKPDPRAQALWSGRTGQKEDELFDAYCDVFGR